MNLLRENGRRRDAFVERERERYEEAIRNHRWADALQGAQGLVERAGVEWAAESVGNLDRLDKVRRAVDEAAKTYSKAVESPDKAAFRDLSDTCVAIAVDFSTLDGPDDPELREDLRVLAGRCDAWVDFFQMEDDLRSHAWSNANERAREILARAAPPPDGEVLAAARETRQRFQALETSVRTAERGYGENGPTEYFQTLEALSREFGLDSVVNVVVEGERPCLVDALRTLSEPGRQAAVSGAEADGDTGRLFPWIVSSVGHGLAGSALLAGWFRYYGLGCERDVDAAERFFEAARREGADGAKDGSGDACYMLAKIRFDRLSGRIPVDDLAILSEEDEIEEAWAMLDEAESRGVPEAAYVRLGIRPPIVPLDELSLSTNVPGLVLKVATGTNDVERRRELLQSVSFYPPAALLAATYEKGGGDATASLPKSFGFSDCSLPFHRLPLLGLPSPSTRRRITPYRLEDWFASGNATAEEEVRLFCDLSSSTNTHKFTRGFAVYLASGLLDRAGRDGLAKLVQYVSSSRNAYLPLMFRLVAERSPSVSRDDVLLRVANDGTNVPFHSAVSLFPEPKEGNAALVGRLMETERGRTALAEWVRFDPGAIDDPDGLDRTLFSQAVRLGDAGLAEALLSAGDIDVNDGIGSGDETPLQLAVSSGDAAMTRLLLKNGADPAFQVDGAPGFFAIVSALGPNGACPTEYIEALVRSDEKFLAQRVGPEKIMPFAWAARSGNVSVLSALLDASGSRIPRETVPRRTALYQAVENGRDVAVQWLCTSFYDTTRDRPLVRSVLKNLEKAGLGSARNRRTLQRFTSESVP